MTWALEAAFLLTALQYIAAIGAVLVLVAVTVQWLDRQIAHRRGANDPEWSFDESDAYRNSPVKDASGGQVWKTKSQEQLKYGSNSCRSRLAVRPIYWKPYVATTSKAPMGERRRKPGLRFDDRLPSAGTSKVRKVAKER